ncbi:uncharacterized protein YabE (DUF348 family) [Salirhabdus euzebyi]|uniref:Uncharacterized protein YabE (DUF348 family) n=1 Tax=Salirhabdus euzebyi TaxID=394506 RepID=A0A841QAB6_9BACI|nr:G5 and 3D domain-containing protein [Salirhabdus euzebyi]MBB6455233.1 uncharacterized protein YabE (DUF348 family) [Salirhabdus euzebyi]
MNKHPFSNLALRVKNTKKLLVLVMSTIVFFASLGILIYETTKADVVLVNNGVEQSVRTHANTVDELLSELDVEAEDYDEVLPNRTDAITSGMTITYTSAQKIKVTVENESTEYYTTAKTIGDFLKEKNIEVHAEDMLTPTVTTEISEGLEISVNKAYEVTVNDGGEEQKVWTTADTIDEFLSSQNIELNELDKLEPSLDEVIAQGTSVTITRIEKVEDVIKESVDYATVTKNDSSLPSGQKKVVQAGKEGTVVKRYEVTLENGKEVDRKLIEEKVEQESQNQIVALGTKPAQPAPTVSRSGDGEVVKELYMSATAYTAYCTGCSGITSTGINLKANPNAKVIAVDPSVIPLGSKVWVEGYGYAIAGDTGGKIVGNRIDVFYPTKAQAYSFGRKQVRVKVYK